MQLKYYGSCTAWASLHYNYMVHHSSTCRDFSMLATYRYWLSTVHKWTLIQLPGAMSQATLSFYFGQEAAASTSTGLSTGEKRPAQTSDTESNPGASKHRKTGINPSWKLDFSWLETTYDTNGKPEMWCTLCRNNNCEPKWAPLGKAVWIEVPCKTITR